MCQYQATVATAPGARTPFRGRVLLWVVLVSVLVATAAGWGMSGTASASHYLRLSNGNIIHWKSSTSSTTRSVRIYDDLQTGSIPDLWRTWINTARIDWDAAARLSLPGGWFESTGDQLNCPIYFSKGIKVCNYPNYNGYGNGGQRYAGLAEFVLVYTTGHLSKGRVRLDDANSGITSPGSLCMDPSGSGKTINCREYAHAVPCQEIGHEFGLDHIGGGTCMGSGYFGDSLGVYRPNATDISHVDASHNHLDSSTSSAAAAEPAGGNAGPPARAHDLVIPNLAPGDCGRRRIGPHTFVERICAPQQASPGLIRAEDVGQDLILVTDYVEPASPS